MDSNSTEREREDVLRRRTSRKKSWKSGKSGEKVGGGKSGRGASESAKERSEIFGEEMRNFSKRFLFVRAAVSCRPAG